MSLFAVIGARRGGLTGGGRGRSGLPVVDHDRDTCDHQQSRSNGHSFYDPCRQPGPCRPGRSGSCSLDGQASQGGSHARGKGLARLGLGEGGFHHGGHLVLEQTTGASDALASGILADPHELAHFARGFVLPVEEDQRKAVGFRDTLQGLIYHGLLFPINGHLHRLKRIGLHSLDMLNGGRLGQHVPLPGAEPVLDHALGNAAQPGLELGQIPEL